MRSSTSIAAGILVALTGLALAGSARASTPAEVDSAVQFSASPDTQSQGYVNFYNSSGRLLTHGNIHDRPFAAAAVASMAPPAMYDGPRRTATLAMMDPVNGQSANEWNGDTATGSTFYADPTHPTAFATDNDYSLADWLTEYSPRWNGLIQLRVLVGAPGLPTLTSSYSSSEIRVVGDHWSLVRSAGALPGSAPVPANLSTALAQARRKESAGPSQPPAQGASSVSLAPRSNPSPPALASVPATTGSTRSDNHLATVIAGACAFLAIGVGAGLRLGRRARVPSQ